MLFAAISNTITLKNYKMMEQKNICFICQALGLVKEGKDYAYVFLVFWQNSKMTTLFSMLAYISSKYVLYYFLCVQFHKRPMKLSNTMNNRMYRHIIVYLINQILK